MVVVKLSLIQKGQNSGCSGRSEIVVYSGGDIAFGAKRSNQWMQWMQYTVDTVCSGCSGIVVYGGGDIVFGEKRSNQWIQWMQSHSGHSTQWMRWMQYTVDTPPYTTIPLH